ncbi:antitoxin Xre/MbcA/ParS toxin-binding domain-containing protein [Alkalimarinus alittae]|uniref:antitoxin Xre/MbcA/ParS toxin-binding domain-containing protein n=1 Tax=Alkalimarinus alittae TaxID=2961619 RepID=UPI003877F110
MLFPSLEQASSWIKKNNSAVPFNGKSALDYMLAGRVSDLAEVRCYLDSALNSPCALDSYQLQLISQLYYANPRNKHYSDLLLTKLSSSSNVNSNNHGV